MHFICCLSLKVFTTTRSFNVCLKNVNKLDIYSHHTCFTSIVICMENVLPFLQLQQLCRRWFGFAVTIVAGTLQQLHCSNLAGGSKNEVAASWLWQPSGNHLQEGCQNQLLQLWYFHKGAYSADIFKSRMPFPAIYIRNWFAKVGYIWYIS